MRTLLMAVASLSVATACGTPAKRCEPGECDRPVDGGATMDAGVDAGTVDAGDLLVATIGSRTGAFDRAQHGIEPDGGLYVEAYFGGDPACPTQTSPSPDRTLIIAGLHLVPDGGALTSADGLRVTLLDFSGALTSAPFVRAITARATPRSVVPGTLVAFTLEATFDGGTAQGSFSAPHCASLDGP